ncbi:hypothetical protein WN55_10013 [Dufourea novaeangliae]|uniref:Uncharacterized protein n=1 Tax=Dufourea novaeangliae TaxID=178035 RepID=A0A154P8E7_DUFNO|nr:hypothetical protein WN55_10013 [Dufourea novaeangliae]
MEIYVKLSENLPPLLEIYGTSTLATRRKSHKRSTDSRLVHHNIERQVYTIYLHTYPFHQIPMGTSVPACSE